MQRAPIDLGKMVERVLIDLAPDTAGRSIEWDCADLPTVEGDPQLMRLVLMNLLSNAVKFTRGREPARISIGSREDADNRERIFYVRDNGVGFDMNYADKLFGAFQRLHSKDEFEGSGIGLANVRRIVHRHGGRSWAESLDKQGATVYFTLPLMPQD
jgi:light-regulated signal transduction histidine kinase (bacteriophytochrome)